MPTANFGTDLDLPRGESRYIRLKAKGDFIKFRLAGTPVYSTSHWIGREKVPCEKYSSEDHSADCRFCEEYEEAVKAGDKEAARDVRPVTTFLYPVLDRTSGRAGIFQFTARSIHYAINNYAKEGVDVFACDWRVERTEEPGAGYYSVMRLSEAILSAEEKEEIKRAGEFSLEGKRSESVSPDEIVIGEPPVEAYE